MSSLISFYDIAKILIRRSMTCGVLCSFEEANDLNMPTVNRIGITTKQKIIIDGLSSMEGDYPINAEKLLKWLGIIDKNSTDDAVLHYLKMTNLISSNGCQELDIGIQKKYMLTAFTARILLVRIPDNDYKFARYLENRVSLCKLFIAYRSVYTSWRENNQIEYEEYSDTDDSEYDINDLTQRIMGI